MKYSILLILILVSFASYSQKLNIDSLENELETMENDTNKVIVLNKIAFSYYQINPQLSIQYANQSFELATKLNYTNGLINCYDAYAASYWVKGEFDISLDFLLKKIAVLEQTDNSIEIANSYLNAGGIYIEIYDLTTAKKYFEKALNIYQKLNSKTGIAKTYNLFGACYSQEKNNEKAFEYYQKSINIFKELNDENNIAYIENNIALIKIDEKKYDEALVSYQNALKIFIKHNEQYSITKVLKNIGDLYAAQKNYSFSKQYYEQALDSAKKYELLKQQMSIYFAFSELDSTFGNFAQAYNNCKYYILLKDSIFNKEKNDKILQLQSDYDNLQTEKENLLLKTETEKNNLIIKFLIGFIALLAIIIFIIIHLFIQKKKSNNLLKQQKDKINSQNIELNEYKNNLEKKIQQRTFDLEIAKNNATEKENLNQSIIDTIPYGMDIVNNEGVILFQNTKFRNFFPKSVIGNKCWETYRDNKTKCDNCPITSSLQIGQTIICYSDSSLNKRIYEITHTGIIYEGQDAMLEIFHDITDRKKAENELIEAKEKAEESSRLKTAFLNNISHEIRTPLNAICGFSQLIVNSKNPIEKQKKFADEILRNSDKLIDIITDVIEISQIQSKQIAIKKNEFVIGHFLTEIKEKFIPIANDKNLWFTINTDIELLKIYTDYEKLKKILFHLIDNAIKFTVQGSINLNIELINNNLIFSIKDTGIGIAENMQKLIFEPFRQVETNLSRNYGGNGLGLTLIKSYVELLNGSISMQSEINKGTTFHITIPSILKIEKVENKIENHKKYKVKTILIAEDEYANYQYLEELLSDSGFHILHAKNGQEAVDFCRNNSTIDLIFMDIKMPIMDGQTATKIIKEFRFDIPIIAQTAYALEIEREKFITDFDDYITKPISKQTLKEKLEKFIL